jgi:hypothetical protein
VVIKRGEMCNKNIYVETERENSSKGDFLKCKRYKNTEEKVTD